MAARRPLLLLLALRGAAAQCSAGQSVGNEDDCNIFARYDVQYTRSFPTWVFMGMPLAILADLDTDVRIVERTDVDTKHCFTHCDCWTGAPRGYEVYVAGEGLENVNGEAAGLFSLGCVAHAVGAVFQAAPCSSAREAPAPATATPSRSTSSGRRRAASTCS